MHSHSAGIYLQNKTYFDALTLFAFRARAGSLVRSLSRLVSAVIKLASINRDILREKEGEKIKETGERNLATSAN